MDTRQTVTPKDPLHQKWASYIRTRDRTTRAFLIEHYLPLVHAAAERIHVKLPESVEVDDLVSAGTFGLMDAVDAFDPDRGVRFETYSAPRIRGAILDELRSMDWAPRLVRNKARSLAEATHSLEAGLGRSPSNGELAKRMGLSARELLTFQKDARTVRLTSIDSVLECDSDRQFRAADCFPDMKAEDPTLRALKNDIRDAVVRGLGRTERLVILLYYFEGMTLKEIGQAVGLSESRVSQMHSAILARLRDSLEGRTTELFAA
jgi:RNA polymerase sigma factor for flagellar operon FliA